MANISTDLYRAYDALWKKISSSFTGTTISIKSNNVSLLERERYYSPSYNATKRSKVLGFFPGCVPCIEISNRLYDDAPILFVGMNSSGADIAHYHKCCKNDVFIYSGNSSYYLAMRKFAFKCLKGIVSGVEKEEQAEGKYSELDLFGIVQSTQEVVRKDFLANPENYVDMFNLFLEYVKRSNPKVIVVANALVRMILKRDSELKLDDDKQYGAFYKNGGKNKFSLEKNPHYGGYIFRINDETEYQLYFSSMLSGQRALDKGNWENLVWLVRNYLNPVCPVCGPKRPCCRYRPITSI